MKILIIILLILSFSSHADYDSEFSELHNSVTTEMDEITTEYMICNQSTNNDESCAKAFFEKKEVFTKYLAESKTELEKYADDNGYFFDENQ